MIKQYIKKSESDIKKLKSAGLTLREIFKLIVVEIGVPCTFSTFKFYYYKNSSK